MQDIEPNYGWRTITWRQKIKTHPFYGREFLVNCTIQIKIYNYYIHPPMGLLWFYSIYEITFCGL